MGILRDIGFVHKDSSKAIQLFESYFPDFRDIRYDKNQPHTYVIQCWTAFEEAKKADPKVKDLGGVFFDCVIATVLAREGLLPLYKSAKVAFVPNVIFDLLLYTSVYGPIALSLKTSLRERYKQADLEAIALKYVHRKALSYLLTLDAHEALNIGKKIKTGVVIGLNKIIIASDSSFDAMVAELKLIQTVDPPTVKVVSSNFVITKDALTI